VKAYLDRTITCNEHHIKSGQNSAKVDKDSYTML